jgi:hypothetical protein
MDEDVSIMIEHPEKRQIVLPRGTRVVIDMVGTCEFGLLRDFYRGST